MYSLRRFQIALVGILIVAGGFWLQSGVLSQRSVGSEPVAARPVADRGARVGDLIQIADAQASPASSSVMRRVYKRLTALDGYGFTSTVNQTTHPLPAVANIGLSSQTESILVTGSVDRQKDLTLLTIVEQSGYLLAGKGQFEFKLQAGEIWGRVQGQEWEQVEEGSSPDKNSSEPAAFLQATRNVQFIGVEERLGSSYQVYTFEVDGIAWAAMMRQEVQAKLRRQGELAPGQVIDSLAYYEKMTGQGELWINSDGLPQRIKFHAVYPPLPNETEYKEVEISSDYGQWLGLEKQTAFSMQTALNSLQTTVSQSLPTTPGQTTGFSFSILLLLFLLLLPIFIVRYRHVMWFHRLLVGSLIALFIFEPLANVGAVQATTQRRETHASILLANHAESDRIQEAVAKVKADFASRFDVNQGLANQRLAEASLLQSRHLADALRSDEVASARESGVFYASAAGEMDTDGDGLSDTLESLLKTDPTKKDSDGDGIDDGSEVNALGLNPIDPDTDGDLISDGAEIMGIQMGGKIWFLDPLNRDTNGDNIVDSLECIQKVDVVVASDGKGIKSDPMGDGLCTDTDQDGTPDFADDDNDDDGVWDWLDGQPQGRFGDLTTGVKDDSFVYEIQHYSVDKPLRVTFELRPTNPQHLWYSMNVLDWPQEDFEGQIRRVHDTKIGSSGSAANGDMQLVPMLEVTMPASDAVHLPRTAGEEPVVGDNNRLAEWLDMAVLERYQMAVSWTQDRQSLRIYVPATLIRDTRGNAPTNFVAKVLYIPNGSGLFSTRHAARLVWMVQLDTDSCIVPEESTYTDSCLPKGKDYQTGIHWQTNKQQIVHRYYDSFYLNAFVAEEDLGANAQIFYEKPDQISNMAAYTPDQLLGLGNLMELYLRQHMSPTEALQAYQAKSPAIGNRLASSSTIHDADTYGLMAQVGTQVTPNLLNTLFSPYKGQLPYPTLLYVTWGRSRLNGLSGIVTGDALEMDMAGANEKNTTTVRVGSFAYNPNPGTINGVANPNWSPVDPGVVWSKSLKNQSVQAYQQLPAAVQKKIDVDSFQEGALSLYWNLTRGTEISADFESSVANASEEATGFIDEFGAAADNGGNNGIVAMIGVLDDFAEAPDAIKQAAATSSGGVASLFGKLSGKDVKNVANVKGALNSAKWAKGIGTTAVTVAGLSATVSLVLAFKEQLGLDTGVVDALEAINASMGAVLGGLQIAQEISKVMQAAQSTSSTVMGGLKQALTFKADLGGVGLYAAILVATVILVAALIMFFKLTDANPVAARTALAQGVATAMIVLILFVIGALFPIGVAIGLIIGLIDGIITAICKIGNLVSDKNKKGENFEDRNDWCNGVVGAAVAAFAGTFYRSSPMVDMGYENRLQFGQTDTKLVEQNGLVGMSADNRLEVHQVVTTTVRIPEAHILNPTHPLTSTIVYSNQIAIDGTGFPVNPHDPNMVGGLMPTSEYDRLIKQKNTFNYELVTSTDDPLNQILATTTTPDKWQSIGESDNRDRLYKQEEPTIQITLSAGVNWNPELQVREYYTMSLAVCALFAGGCDYKFEHFTRKEAGTRDVLELGSNLIYDVFPSTLTEFYTLAQVQENGQFVNRYRLAWGGDKKPFPTLVDADGDGLRSDGTGALDPDDKTGDKDNDGLPDPFEVQDYRLNPSSADSDNDGLNDYQEIRYGTRPDRADSDNDGLNDGDEITGWEFLFIDADNVTRRTWVTSDPLLFDTDGDGFSDQQERVFAFHPRAKATNPSILTIHTSTSQSSGAYLGPQQSIAFTSTVKNELLKPIAYGLLEAEILNSDSAIAPVVFELQPQQSTTLQGTILAPAAPISGASDEITLRNRAGANMVDPSATYASQLQGLAQPDGLKFQLNFEQRPGITSFFEDVTGKATVSCTECPDVVRQTNSYATFQARNWFWVHDGELAFTQPKFSVGGWVTLRRAFGEEYSERILFGDSDLNGAASQYLQLSVVDLFSTPKVKIRFTATDGAQCEQVLTGLTLAYEQKSHLFVTYDGTVVRGYKNGTEAGSYTLQNCANKVPAGDGFTIGRGTTQAKLHVDNLYVQEIDEGSWPSRAEPYLLLDDSSTPFWNTTGVANGNTLDVGQKLSLIYGPYTLHPDFFHTIYVCEEDSGDKQGKCVSDATDSDDFHGMVTIIPNINRTYDTRWSSNEGSGNLRYNVQNNFFQGDLDDLRIYENTLNAQQVSQIVNGGGMVYQLDEASGRDQFRTAGTDTTQLACQTAGNCPTSGLKGYSGQAVRFGGESDQALAIDRLRERFGSNFVVSFWLNPALNSSTSGPVSLIRSGQGTEGYALYATSTGASTALNPRFMFSETGFGAIGGSGGSAFDIRCNANEALVGVYGGAGGMVDRVGPLCVAIDGAGNWLGEPTQSPTAGGAGGGAFDRRCERNSVVVGFTGRAGGLVDQITLQCAPLGQDGYAETGNRVSLPSFGGGGGSPQDQRICPSNFPAAGIRGRSGGLVDAFGLLCRDQFTGNARTTIPNGQWSHIALAQRDDTLLLYVNGQLRQTIWFGSPSLSQYRLRSNTTPDLTLGSWLQGLLDEVQIQGLDGSTDEALNAQMNALYQASAVAYLPFDETGDSTTFVNSTGKANLVCADATNCPQAGIKGQVRESVLFNGQPGAPSLTIPDQRNAAFSFSTWVKIPNAPVGSAALVSLHDGTASDLFAWRLQLTNKEGRAVPEFIGRTSPDGSSCDSGTFAVAPKDQNGDELSLALNQWHHLGVSYNPLGGQNDLSLYINGQLAIQEPLSSQICRVGTALRFGQQLKGQLDEFVFYQKPLVTTEFLSQYVYQSTWYDVVSTETFKVDYQKPTLRLTANPFVKAGVNIFGVAVSDAESGIRSVEYKENDGQWKSATTETATAGVWSFALDVQGSKTVEVRATDNVGNVSTDSKTVDVDNTPPVVTLTTSGKQKTLTLQGTASDSGSGIQSVAIMLIDALGNPLSSPRDVQVANGLWRYSQELPPVINGAFQIWMAAVDQLGNSFEGILSSVQVDTAPPTVGLLANSLSYSGVEANLPLIKGYVTDQPYPEGMALLIGFEDVASAGPLDSTLDMAGNQWQATPASGTSGPTALLANSDYEGEFQLGQTLVITNANPSVKDRRFTVDPNSATVTLWINPSSTGLAEQKIIHQDAQRGFGLVLKGANVTLRINRTGAPVDRDTGQRLVAGQWQRLTVSLDRLTSGDQVITTWVGDKPGKSLTLRGNQRIVKSNQTLTIGAASNGYAGRMDDIVVYARPLTELEARQLANSSPSAIQKVEVGFLDRRDNNNGEKVIWRQATLLSPNQEATLWQVQAPAGLEGIFDMTLRTSDALNNERTQNSGWSGVIDTLAPRIALSGAVAGQHQCVVTDFSLGQNPFVCADVQDAAGAAKANYAAGKLASAGLTWNAQWYTTLFQRSSPPARLYAMQQTGRNFFTAANTAESCDVYGNCTRCTVSNNDLAVPVCTVYAANARLSAAGVAAPMASTGDADDSLAQTAIVGPQGFVTTVRYERPDAYEPGAEPGAPTSSWHVINEPYALIDDAVLASTRPFAASFSAAKAEISWGESVSATHYYVGWTLAETVVLTDLTAYAAPGVHEQTLPDKGRYYAHVVAVDAAGRQNGYLLGPVYFDGATPASYLNWDEFGPGQPYREWQDARSATGQLCNLLGLDNRAGLFSNGTSPRSETQYLYGTWSDEWLALHWQGVDLQAHGDLHLYLDTKPGGGNYAYDPYHPIDQATALIAMPERRATLNTADRMLADFAVIVEDSETMRFLSWDGAGWQPVDASQIRVRYSERESIIWLPLALLGIQPAAVDLSLVGFVTEENDMQVWATMPGNNPLNSPSAVPEHLRTAQYFERIKDIVLNLQTAVRLSSNPEVNSTLDNCPTNFVLDSSILDVDLVADPAGTPHNPFFDSDGNGIDRLVPIDIGIVAVNLCGGAENSFSFPNSPVCQVAFALVNRSGISLLSPAVTGAEDEVTYYATVRNLSSQDSGDITLAVATYPYRVGNVESADRYLSLGTLAPLESRVISFTNVIDAAPYPMSHVSIYPIESVSNGEKGYIRLYEHEPETLITFIDVEAPYQGAEITSVLIDNTIGVGVQVLEGLVNDDSLITTVFLQTSLLDFSFCMNTQKFSYDSTRWVCPITIPEDTPDGTEVRIFLGAEDKYGNYSSWVNDWTFIVDNTPPQVLLNSTAQVDAITGATNTLVLDGLVWDDRHLEGVTVCNTLQGYERCQSAQLYFFSDIVSDTVPGVAHTTQAIDKAAWHAAMVVDSGIENVVEPFVIRAFDVYGNGVERTVELEIDTTPPAVTLASQPLSQIAIDGSLTLAGLAQDKGEILRMELEVLTPLGEVESYSITLDTPNSPSTLWHYDSALAPGQFGMSGRYSYAILTYDTFGNLTKLGPYELVIDTPPAPKLNAPTFVMTSNDLWANFAAGAPIHMVAYFDDADLEIGDQITVTANPLPSWLVINRLDLRTLEISGTVPITIFDTITGSVGISDSVNSSLQLNVGVLLEDSTGKQAYQTWSATVTAPLHLVFFPQFFISLKPRAMEIPDDTLEFSPITSP